jgi:hypothetical protein
MKQRRPIDAADALRSAALQGFDDGYFRHEHATKHATEAERAAYAAEFALGRDQRKDADRAAKKRKIGAG